MATEHIPGELEINYETGEIYFHTSDPEVIQNFKTVTPLRIKHFPPKALPPNQQIDICIQAPVTFAAGLSPLAWAIQQPPCT